MKPATTVALAGAIALLSGSAWGQQPSQEELIQRRDKKMKEAFVEKAPWILDYEKAMEEAAKTGKLIFAYFTRSYSP